MSDSDALLNDDPVIDPPPFNPGKLPPTIDQLICHPTVDNINITETNNSTISNTQSLDPTTYSIFTYIENHPQAPDSQVISKVNWDDLPTLSDPDIATEFAKHIFKYGNYWINKKTLYKQLEIFGSKTGFTPSTLEGSCFGCNRAGKQRVRSKTGFARKKSAGELRVDCKWLFRIASVFKNIKQSRSSSIKPSVKNSYLDSDLVYITTKNPLFKHTLPCKPSVVQVMYTNRTSGKYVSNVSDVATYTLIGLLKSNPTVKSSIIRSILKPNFPNKEYVSNTDIYNTKMRCYRLMPLYEECNADYQLFMENLKQTKNIIGIDYEAETEDIAVKLSEDVWSEILSNSTSSQLEDNAWNLKSYMVKMAEQCPGFSYRFAYDSNGVCNGVLWMTATMRENFRRFGSSISLDAMKRGINTYLWHYFAVVMINDVNSNCLATEGMIVAEREDAYKFIIESTISMGLEVRKNTQIYCVAGDGIFNQNSLLKWKL